MRLSRRPHAVDYRSDIKTLTYECPTCGHKWDVKGPAPEKLAGRNRNAKVAGGAAVRREKWKALWGWRVIYRTRSVAPRYDGPFMQQIQFSCGNTQCQYCGETVVVTRLSAHIAKAHPRPPAASMSPKLVRKPTR
jgi:DNA-directed RNA polymerase subunit RPC12/RpoP